MREAYEIAESMDRRPGYSVVAYREVGLPVFRFSVLMTLQEEGTLGVIEEFVLRCLRRGINTVDEIQKFLGLPREVVAQQVGQGLSENSVQSAGRLCYQLTGAGKERLDGSGKARLISDQVPVFVDGVTRKVIWAEEAGLYTSSQLEDMGVETLSPSPRKPPSVKEIKIDQINRVFDLAAGDRDDVRRCIELKQRAGNVYLRFRPAVAVAYKSDDGKKVSIGFALNGQQSVEHEVAWAEHGGPERSGVFSGLLDSDRRRREVRNVNREFRRDCGEYVKDEGGGEGQSDVLTLGGVGSQTRGPQPSGEVRVLSVYEHPPILLNALEEAEHRLLIISPWIRANVVDKEFIEKIAACAGRGVEITIAHGLGRRDKGERDKDKEARQALEALQSSYPNLRVVWKGNTHAKVLLVDDRFFVTTSFNWLSFKGDPKQPMREEEGTLVEGRAATEQYFARLQERMSDNR